MSIDLWFVLSAVYLWVAWWGWRHVQRPVINHPEIQGMFATGHLPYTATRVLVVLIAAVWPVSAPLLMLRGRRSLG